MTKPSFLARLFVLGMLTVATTRTHAQTLEAFAPTPNGPVTSASADANGKLLVGGTFSNLSGVARARFGRINHDGTTDTTLSVGVSGGASSPVYSILVHPDGTLWLGGDFTQFGGESHGRLARILANGSLDSAFTTSADGIVFALALQADGKILVAGAFANLGGQAHSHIGRLNADGTVDASFTASANGDVVSMLVQANGSIVIAGSFTEVSGSPRNRIARLNADGSLDASFNPNANNNITGLAQQLDGKILAFGTFTTISGVAQNRYVRLNADGSRDTSFVLPTATAVTSMAVQADGKVIVSGGFTHASITGTAIIRVDSNGTFDSSFTPVTIDQLPHVVIDGDGNIYAAGQFTTIAGAARTNLARIDNPTAPASTLERNGTDIDWDLGGSAAVPTVVWFQSTTDGSTWTDIGAGTLDGGLWQHQGATLPSGTTQIRAWGIVPTNGSDSTLISATANISVTPAASRLLNISTRAQVGTGDNVMIPGFVVTGAGTKQVLIRAVGPTLGKAPFGLSGVLPNPRMTLKRLDTSVNPAVSIDVASNDEWETNTNAADITSVGTSVGAFELNDAHEAALLVNVQAGQYTVVVDDANGASGVAIVEVYDADTNPTATVINISNRGFVGTNEQVMIPGFVISSEGPKTVLIRAVGPTLGGAPFNVQGTMSDPKFDLYRRENNTDVLVASQDNWGDDADVATTVTVSGQVSAFTLNAGSKDAAFVRTLQPGAYTVVTSSAVAGETGVVLVELYVAP